MKNGGKFNWSSAFAGSISSYLSVGIELFGDGAAAIGGRTLIMAMVGGTTSVITGGKFEDGAVSAAFVHLFNSEDPRIYAALANPEEHPMAQILKNPNEIYKKISTGLDTSMTTIKESNNAEPLFNVGRVMASPALWSIGDLIDWSSK